MINAFNVKNFGPIKEATTTFGDLTILIGAQASGKSLFLQLLKLILDKRYVVATMDKYNYVIAKNPDNILNFYFGDGLSKMWNEETTISDGVNTFKKTGLLGKGPVDSKESLFYIPAQRIISISDGRPKNFMEYDASTPFVLRQFSETLRMFFQYGLNGSKVVFPIGTRLKSGVKKSFQNSIFHNGKVTIDDTSGQKKMQLSVDNMNIPFMAWSAGQKEFMPLLMAFYCLSGPPQNVVDRNQYNYVVLEEPEMGLHPRAIQSVLLQTIELVQNGYKVLLSTHSQVLLEFAWAFNIIKSCDATEVQKGKLLRRMLGVENYDSISIMMNGIFDKRINTYYFNNTGEGVRSTDISSLDVTSDDLDISDWGGLSQFSGKTSEIVSKVINGDYE
ncbi:MAG: ATP-binding protein [Bacteroidales bacterium]|nr:ATP-binding protein [Bacteroidales bacterium]